MPYKFNPTTSQLDLVNAATVATPAGTTTQVQYNNAGAFGGANAYWDNVNNRLGINVASPGKKLEVGGHIIAHTETVGGSASVFLNNDNGQTWEFFSNNGGQFGIYDDINFKQPFAIDPNTDANLFKMFGNTVTTTGNQEISAVGGAKGYRFRTTGSNLDVDFGGADAFVSVFSGAAYSGTQYNYLRLESGANIAHAIGSWQFSSTPFAAATTTIDGTTGNVVIPGTLTMNATSIVTDTTTGLKIGTSTTQKLGFFNNTPIAKQGATVDLGTVLSNFGLRTGGTAYPITTTGATSLTGSNTLSGMTISDGSNVVLGTTTGTQIGTAATQKLGFYGKTPVVQQGPYTVTNVTPVTAYDPTTSTGVQDKQAIGTLFKALQSSGIFG